MEPTLLVRELPPPPVAGPIVRAITAVCCERRLPFHVSQLVDRLCNVLGFAQKTVTADGIRFRVRRLTTDERIVQHVVREKEYCPPGFGIAATDTVVDIGANIGAFSLLASRAAPFGRVFAFEPVMDNYALLLRNIASNRAANIVPSRQAILDARTTAKIYLNRNNTGGHSVIQQDSEAGFQEVECITLQDVFDTFQIECCNLLKLDCEGAEYKILYQLPRAYFARIARIAMEYHSEMSTKRQQADELVAFLQENGYHVERYVDVVGSGEGFVFARRT